MIKLRTTDGGILLPVRAQPGARRNALVGEQAGRLKVAVTQVAEKGKANAEIIRLLADALGLKRTQITLRSGATGALKVLHIAGIEETTLQRRIAALLERPS
jgi:uncharacterized protein (TIGR00251 family)